MRSILLLLAIALAGSLSVVGMAIGLFYRRKFGEGTRGWLLGVGAALGTLGAGLFAVPSLPPIAGDLVLLGGAAFLGTGTFWLWYVMLGPRR
jgi:hypothetical protein